MGWFSLVTKVVPKLWRGGTKVTSTLWNGGASVAGAGTKVVTAVAKNPKTTVVTGVAAYAGWDKLTNPDESIGTAVGKTLRDGVEGVGGFAHDTVNGFTGEKTVEQVRDTATSVVSDLQGAASETKGLLGTIGDSLRGISSFLGNLFGGVCVQGGKRSGQIVYACVTFVFDAALLALSTIALVGSTYNAFLYFRF